MISRLFKNSVVTAAMAAGLTLTPVAAHAQSYTAADQYQYAGDQYQYQGQPNQYQGQPTYQYPTDPNAPQNIQQVPPAIPDYAQPAAPADGYIWTPGYWAWNGYGYVWVQGAWVAPPYVGALWTPGYWGGGPYGYFWNAGYWGPTVGYYGGINYGFGYFGIGFYGGYWGGGHFWYNSAYCRLGFRSGYVYTRPYSGYAGHPGGASFVRTNYSRPAGGQFRGSSINSNIRPSTLNNRISNAPQGRSFAEQGRSFNQQSTARSFAQQAPQARSFAQSAPQMRSYAQPSAGRSFSAPSASRSFSGGSGGGGFHGGGGGFSGGGHGGGGRR